MVSSSKNHVLPDEYQEVQWLRGSGSQYSRLPFSLGFSDGHFYGMKGDLESVDGTRYSTLSIISQNENPSSIHYYAYGAKVQYGSCDTGLLSGSISNNNYIEYDDSLIYHFEINSNSLVINNTVLSNPDYNNSGLGGDIYIGSYVNTSGNRVVDNSNVYIKYLAIFYDDTLLCEVIPCYRKSDNKAGFYLTNPPTGSSNFIVNSNSGTDWLVGPNV